MYETRPGNGSYNVHAKPSVKPLPTPSSLDLQLQCEQSATRDTLTTVAPTGGRAAQGLRAAAAGRGRGRGRGGGRGTGGGNTLSAAAAKTIGGVLGATTAVATPAEVAAAAAVDTARLFASKLNQVEKFVATKPCGWFQLPSIVW